MQTLTRPNYSPARSDPGDSQAVKVAILAVILFALSGLITGFAFGAFVHFSPAKSSNATTSLTTSQQNTGNTTTTTTKKGNPKPLGFPVITPSAYIEKADGSTIYSIGVQVTDQKNGPLAAGLPLPTSGVTCKIWLTKNARQSSTGLSANNYAIPKAINNIQNPVPGEISGGLNFTTTSQTQMSNAKGQATWKYTVSPSVAPGTYYLMVLTDWNGVHYNWSWVDITIKQAD